MGKKAQNFRAWLHQNPNATIQAAWNAGWKSHNAIQYSRTIQERDAEIERLREALEFYADRRRYDNAVAIDRGDGSHDYSTEILEDEGAIAQAALAATEPTDRSS